MNVAVVYAAAAYMMPIGSSPLKLSGAWHVYRHHGQWFGQHNSSSLPWFLFPEEAKRMKNKAVFEKLHDLWYSGEYHPMALVHRGLLQEHFGVKGQITEAIILSFRTITNIATVSMPSKKEPSLDKQGEEQFTAPPTDPFQKLLSDILTVPPPLGEDLAPLKYTPASTNCQCEIGGKHFDKRNHPAFDRSLPIPFTRFSVMKLWLKCADILEEVYKKYDELVEEEAAAGVTSAAQARPSVFDKTQTRTELLGGQKCASVVDKTLAVLDLPKRHKERRKMPKSQQMLPEIWKEALKDVEGWKVEDLVWEHL